MSVSRKQSGDLATFSVSLFDRSSPLAASSATSEGSSALPSTTKRPGVSNGIRLSSGSQSGGKVSVKSVAVNPSAPLPPTIPAVRSHNRLSAVHVTDHARYHDATTSHRLSAGHIHDAHGSSHRGSKHSDRDYTHTPHQRLHSMRHTPSTASSTTAAASSPALFSRVRVAVRCRPPFAEEGADSIVNVLPPGAAVQSQIPVDPSIPSNVSRGLHVDIAPGKRREFAYDVVFGPSTTNTDVYNIIGGPVVDAVLKGVNGTVLAYGQTGSGKTHSLGILTRVTGESGVIPRSLSHIFGAIALANQQAGDGPKPSYVVTMSFCQLYLDTVQDLLVSGPGMAAPGQNLAAAGGGFGDLHTGLSTPNTASDAASIGSGSMSQSKSGNARDRPERPERDYSGTLANTGPGLAVREDPSRGFYVEGLSEYCIKSFSEACSLLNWGLENRILGATRMNATSSRSHTILTVKVEVREPVAIPAPDGGEHEYGFVSRKSQLMLCDLAGSERVRRTSSRGARLEEARAINASLHTLGQVIAALSSISTQTNSAIPRIHVPWRDSKLTRLLYGNLGGSSNTFLLATVGPGVKNASETISTLLFAARCMRVTAQPVLASAMGNYNNADYADLCARLQARLSGIEAEHAVEMAALVNRYESAIRDISGKLDDAHMDRRAGKEGSMSLQPANQAIVSSGISASTPSGTTHLMYHSLVQAYNASLAGVLSVLYRAGKHAKSWERAVSRAAAEESAAAQARQAMLQHDPLLLQPAHKAGTHTLLEKSPHPDNYGPHLGHAYRSSAAALSTVHMTHAANHIVASAAANAADKKLSSLPVPPSSQQEGPGGADNQFNAVFAEEDEATSLQTLKSVTPASQASFNDLLAPPFTPAEVVLSEFSASIISGAIHQPSFTLKVFTTNKGVTSSNSSEKDEQDDDDDTHSQLDEAEAMSERAIPATSAVVLDSLAAAILGQQNNGDSHEDEHFALAYYPPYSSFSDPDKLHAFVEALAAATKANVARLNAVAAVKDARFDEVKRHLAAAEAAVRTRDEDAANQRYVLRYLVDTTSNLREEVRRLRGALTVDRSKLARLSESYSVSSSPRPSPTPSANGSRRGSVTDVSKILDDSMNSGRFTPADDDSEWGFLDGGGASALTSSTDDGLQTRGKTAFQKLLQRHSHGATSSSVSFRGANPSSGTTPQATVASALKATPIATSASITEAQPSAAVVTTTTTSNSTANNFTLYTASAAVSTASLGTPKLATGAHTHVDKHVDNDDEEEEDYADEKYDAFDYADEADEAVPGEDEVEYIVSHKVTPPTRDNPFGRVLYRVHWRGTTPAEDEWFDREDLMTDFPKVVRAYESRTKSLVIPPGS